MSVRDKRKTLFQIVSCRQNKKRLAAVVVSLFEISYVAFPSPKADEQNIGCVATTDDAVGRFCESCI